MTRKKKKVSEDASLPARPPTSTVPNPLLSPTACHKEHTAEPSIVICHISSFHGPWLQLPPEVLESLAYINYESPRPRPIDPVVFFNLVKIRRLVDEATDLAVRATNGTTLSSMVNLLNGGNSSAVFGLGTCSGGSSTKLSRERRHRMRENATHKLSQAYQLDEVATSVAVMQGASSLEEVAKLVLHQNPSDSDAKYVHFFHEKIPSRKLASSTSLQLLDEIILERPTESATLRTRALTKILKKDYAGATNDLSAALAICRYQAVQHQDWRAQLKLAVPRTDHMRRNSDRGDLLNLGEADSSKNLEAQLLFYRADAYLALACQNINVALDEYGPDQEESRMQSKSALAPTLPEALERGFKGRKIVKTNARKALRDYLLFLSHFDYSLGKIPDISEDFVLDNAAASNGFTLPQGAIAVKDHLGMSQQSDIESDSLLHTPVPPVKESVNALSVPRVYPISTLFSSSPPDDLPPFPATPQALVPCKPTLHSNHEYLEQHEVVTYHPLLTDALHSLLLCHSLCQTSPKEHLRHSHMVARVARLCDGYPAFLAARSPSRADWIEVLHLADNWLGLQHTWEALCDPAQLQQEPPEGPKRSTRRAKDFYDSSGRAEAVSRWVRQVRPKNMGGKKAIGKSKEESIEALPNDMATRDSRSDGMPS